jgi:plasmid stabilization system protein ParE
LSARPRRHYTLYNHVRADREIVAARSWWRANRIAAPNALDAELRSTFRLLARHPRVGSLTRSTRTSGVRRVLLPNTRYLLYYRVSEQGRTIEILSFWHASRGSPPAL